MQVYLDHHSAPPLSAAVREAVAAQLAQPGHPGASHRPGRAAREVIERARQAVATLINAPPDGRLVFTAGATEATNLALRGYVLSPRRGSGHLVATRADHIATLASLAALARDGCAVTLLEVDRYGVVAPGDVAAALRDDTRLVSVMAANNEVGSLLPLDDLGAALADHPAVLHVDARAAFALPIDVQAQRIDLLSLSATTVGGPPGAGALYVGPRLRLTPLLRGGGQEHGLRAGRENVPALAGFGVAAELARSEMVAGVVRLTALRQRLVAGAFARVNDTALNGHPHRRLPGHASLRFAGLAGEALQFALEQEGIIVGAGSVCTARSLDLSHVLRAMGLPREAVLSTITVTLGRETTAAEIDYLLARLPPAVERLRALNPLR